MARADLSPGGSCYKCHHDIASHPRRPTGKCPIINEIVHTDTFISSHFFLSFRLCHKQQVIIDSQ